MFNIAANQQFFRPNAVEPFRAAQADKVARGQRAALVELGEAFADGDNQRAVRVSGKTGIPSVVQDARNLMLAGKAQEVAAAQKGYRDIAETMMKLQQLPEEEIQRIVPALAQQMVQENPALQADAAQLAQEFMSPESRQAATLRMVSIADAIGETMIENDQVLNTRRDVATGRETVDTLSRLAPSYEDAETARSNVADESNDRAKLLETARNNQATLSLNQQKFGYEQQRDIVEDQIAARENERRFEIDRLLAESLAERRGVQNIAELKSTEIKERALENTIYTDQEKLNISKFLANVTADDTASKVRTRAADVLSARERLAIDGALAGARVEDIFAGIARDDKLADATVRNVDNQIVNRDIGTVMDELRLDLEADKVNLSREKLEQDALQFEAGLQQTMLEADLDYRADIAKIQADQNLSQQDAAREAAKNRLAAPSDWTVDADFNIIDKVSGLSDPVLRRMQSTPVVSVLFRDAEASQRREAAMLLGYVDNQLRSAVRFNSGRASNYELLLQKKILPRYGFNVSSEAVVTDLATAYNQLSLISRGLMEEGGQSAITSATRSELQQELNGVINAKNAIGSILRSAGHDAPRGQSYAPTGAGGLVYPPNKDAISGLAPGTIYVGEDGGVYEKQ